MRVSRAQHVFVSTREFMTHVIIQSRDLVPPACIHLMRMEESLTTKVPKGPLLIQGLGQRRTFTHAQLAEASQGTDHDGHQPARCQAACY